MASTPLRSSEKLSLGLPFQGATLHTLTLRMAEATQGASVAKLLLADVV